MAEEEFDGSGTMILAPGDLKMGMHVSYLDRPWSDSPFPFQGFKIETEAELKKLKETCEYVFVDAKNSDRNYQGYFEERSRPSAAEETRRDQEAVVLLPTEKEFPAARAIHAELRDAMIECYNESTAGRQPDLTRLERSSRAVIDSVRRAPDALLYFVRTQTEGDYIYRHGVACAVMLCVLGHSMGKSVQSLKKLTMGGALLDIGKTRVPGELLNRPRATQLTPGELQQLKRHVERGAEIISQVTSEGGPLVTMIMSHHERHNGSGYPRRLAGGHIPQFGQMAAIVDMFDAMISERCYGRRATPYEAMRYMKAQRDQDFNASLVKEFEKAFGSYPTGSLIQLSTGAVGIVIQQTGSRLQPRVYMLLDPLKNREPEFKVIDLSSKAYRQTVIEKCLKPGSYGIDY
ncbi:MAG: DUF3391 domain-containing protein [Gammaproteobacteria bacterium]|nr:DUF3391 domain-containing protein [Gammaproteobacteria bacterium]NNF67997.1 DUF3391 domain-containing protein [Gammaproteobacteria bacterium]